MNQFKVRMAAGGLLQCIAVFATVLCACANPLEQWNQRLPGEIGPLSSRIVYGNGLYVSVGVGGAIRISADVTNWVAVSAPATENLTAVTYAQGLFAAVGEGGTILNSTNGVDWKRVDLGADASLRAITFGNGRFVAVGFNCAAVSSNGVTWTRAVVPPTGNILDIAYGNQVFVAAAYYGDAMWSSEDGLNWTRSLSLYRDGEKQVAFGNGVFVLVAEGVRPLYTSVEGVSWNEVPFNGETFFSAICFGDGVFSAGLPTSAISSDGTNWIVAETVGGRNPNYANGQFLAQWPSGQLRVSEDAVTWRTIQYPAPRFRTVAYADGAFVALGSLSARSTNGQDWLVGSSITPFGDADNLAFGNGIHVATSSWGVHTSTDGLSWAVPASGGPTPYRGVAFGTGWFVIYDRVDRSIKRSRDGTNWQSAIPFYYSMQGVAFGNDQFVAAMGDGTVLVSSNAFDWSSNVVGTAESLLGISFANGSFFAGTRSTTGNAVRRCYSSTDGINWTGLPAGPDGVPSGNRIIFFDEMFVSPADFNQGGSLLASTNGVNWLAVRSQHASSIIGLATDGHTMVGVSRSGVFQSGSLLPTVPAILTHPSDRSVEVGATALLSVVASGSSPLVYQWLRDGAVLDGETNAQLLLRDVEGRDAGSYSVNISNGLGVASSQPARLTVIPAPSVSVIARQPTGGAKTVGQTAYFGVLADGAPPLRYQWTKNGEPIAYATNSTYLFRILRESDAGEYVVTIHNDLGAVASDVANLAVSQPDRTVILFHPQAQVVTNGGTAVFEAEAAGVGPLRYQWWKSSFAIPGATNRMLTLTNVQTGQAGGYAVFVTNGIGSVAASWTATLTVYSSPYLIEQPTSLNVAVGVPIVLNPLAAGVVPKPRIQWLKNGKEIAFATNLSLKISNAQMADSGVYSVTVSNLVGSVSTEPLTVTVFPLGPLDLWNDIAQLTSDPWIFNVTWAGDAFYAVGFRSMAKSTNGVDWAEVDFGVPITNAFYDIAYGGSQFVAVGDRGGIAFTYQEDSSYWAFTRAPIQGDLSAVTYGNGLFVAVGVQNIGISSNGEDWIARTNSSASLVDVAFGSGRFVAVGSHIVHSMDGITWTDCVVPTSASGSYRSVVAGSRNFVVVGQSGIFNSDDGVVWREADAPVPLDAFRVTYGDGVFMALSTTAVYSSIDGATWVRRNPWTNSPPFGGTFGSPNQIAFGGGRFLHIADRNRVFASEPMLKVGLRRVEGIELLIWSLTGRTCRIESAPSLESGVIWTPVGDVELDAFPMVWLDPQGNSGDLRYYRAVIVGAQ